MTPWVSSWPTTSSAAAKPVAVDHLLRRPRTRSVRARPRRVAVAHGRVQRQPLPSRLSRPKRGEEVVGVARRSRRRGRRRRRRVGGLALARGRGAVHGTSRSVLFGVADRAVLGLAIWLKFRATVPRLGVDEDELVDRLGAAARHLEPPDEAGRSGPGPPSSRGVVDPQLRRRGAEQGAATTPCSFATAASAVLARRRRADRAAWCSTRAAGSASPLADRTLPSPSRLTTSSPPSTGTPSCSCWKRTAERPGAPRCRSRARAPRAWSRIPNASPWRRGTRARRVGGWRVGPRRAIGRPAVAPTKRTRPVSRCSATRAPGRDRAQRRRHGARRGRVAERERRGDGSASWRSHARTRTRRSQPARSVQRLSR